MVEKQIILVEDDGDISFLINYILSEFYHLRICTTIAQAKREIEKEIPDLFLLDIMLPDGNGVDFCEQIKNAPKTNRIPIILMSANDLSDKSTADSFIAKPFDIETFKAVVKKYL